VGHRSDIGLEQQVVGQVRLDVQLLQPRDPGPLGLKAELGGANEVGLPERRPQLEREDLHQARVAALPRRGRELQQAGYAHGRRARLLREAAQRPGSRSPAGEAQPRGQLVRRIALVARERLVAAVTG